MDDIAEGLALAGEHLTGPEFVNLASGREVSIRELVHTIADLCGFTGQIRFDATKAGGDPRRSATPIEPLDCWSLRHATRLKRGFAVRSTGTVQKSAPHERCRDRLHPSDGAVDW